MEATEWKGFSIVRVVFAILITKCAPLEEYSWKSSRKRRSAFIGAEVAALTT
jgi:hypothetical protein